MYFRDKFTKKMLVANILQNLLHKLDIKMFCYPCHHHYHRNVYAFDKAPDKKITNKENVDLYNT